MIINGTYVRRIKTNYREILRFYAQGNTTTQIATLCECSRTTVLSTIKRAKEAKLSLPVDELMRDEDLYTALFPRRVRREGYAVPDFDWIDREKSKRKINKLISWRRYCKRALAAGLKPYKKTQFYKLYDQFFRYHSFGFKLNDTLKKAMIYKSNFAVIDKHPERVNKIKLIKFLHEIRMWCIELRLDVGKVFPNKYFVET